MTIAKKTACSLIAVMALSMIAPVGQAAEEWAGDPYSLNVCPISGEPLTEMGEPIVEVIAGREVRFCCASCSKKFNKDPEASLKKIDAKLIKDQLAVYPLDTCIISGEKLEKDDTISFIVGNRLFKTCCTSCKKKVIAKPAVHVAKLNAAVIAAQKDIYSLKTCPISGDSLSAMGEPIDMVLANRLVRLCCNSCKKKLAADPAKFIAMIDAAAGRETPASVADGSDMKLHEEHSEEHSEEHTEEEAGSETKKSDAGSDTKHNDERGNS